MTAPFQGEMMTCIVCGATEQSTPDMQSNWRAIDLDGHRIFACPREFPPDGAGRDAFKTAYGKVLRCAISKLKPNVP